MSGKMLNFTFHLGFAQQISATIGERKGVKIVIINCGLKKVF